MHALHDLLPSSSSDCGVVSGFRVNTLMKQNRFIGYRKVTVVVTIR